MKRVVCCLLTVICVITFITALPSYAKEPIVNYQVLFSPEAGVADQLISMIEKENRSIKVAIYALMHSGIARALIEAHGRGVDVQVIVDPFSVKNRSLVRKLESTDLPIYVWSPAEKYKRNKNGKNVKQRPSLMHDKFCVLGDTQVWTGSCNFTFQASLSNRENVVILESAELASSFLEEFERLKREGCVPLKEYLSKLDM